jgi:hypothetical protein
VSMRRIPLDPLWLLIPILAGIALGLASVSIESWSIAFTYLGIALGALPATIGIDRWLERNRPRRPR